MFALECRLRREEVGSPSFEIKRGKKEGVGWKFFPPRFVTQTKTRKKERGEKVTSIRVASKSDKENTRVKCTRS